MEPLVPRVLPESLAARVPTRQRCPPGDRTIASLGTPPSVRAQSRATHYPGLHSTLSRGSPVGSTNLDPSTERRGVRRRPRDSNTDLRSQILSEVESTGPEYPDHYRGRPRSLSTPEIPPDNCQGTGYVHTVRGPGHPVQGTTGDRLEGPPLCLGPFPLDNETLVSPVARGKDLQSGGSMRGKGA